MAITYTPTTNFGAKDSLPTNDPDKVIKGSEFTTEFTAIQTAFSLAAPAASPTFTGTVTIPTADINGGNIDGTVIGGATPAAGSFTTGQFGTSLNVDGTVTADGLTMGVGNEIELTGAGEKIFASSGGLIDLQARDSIQLYTDSNNNNSVSATSFAVWTGGTEATATSKQLLIQKSGDISFYEDTGTTPKFFWDASAERLGLGTTSPAELLDVNGHINLADGYELKWGGAGATIYGSNSNNQLRLYTNNTERMRIDSSGNVGLGNGAYIGTLSSAHSLSIQGGAGAPGGKITLYGGTGSNRIDFLIGASEAMRLDASGNLLVGTTDDAPGAGNTNAGVAIRGGSDNRSFFSVSSNYVAAFNRNTNDGNIIEFNKDGTGVGNIGTGAGSIYIGSNSQSSGVSFYGTALYPNNGGSISATNGANDIGAPTARWKDLYLSGGVYLGGTGAANLLDDYEEGTHTITVTPLSGGSITVSTTYNTMYYTKIGRVVICTGYFVVSSVSSPSGVLDISLPFSAKNVVNNSSSVYIACNGMGGGSISEIWGIIDTNSGSAKFYYGAGSSVGATVANNVVATTDIRFQATYIVD